MEADLELEMLTEIFREELEVGEGRRVVGLEVRPEADEDRQFVKLYLRFTLPESYPSTPATPAIINPRGLTGDEVQGLLHDLEERCRTKAEDGEVVIYELVEHTKAFLLAHNTPHDACVLCLDAVSPEDAWRTPCYHFFHHACIHKYVEYSRKNPVVEETLELHQRMQMYTDEAARQRAYQEYLEQLPIVCPVCRLELSRAICDEACAAYTKFAASDIWSASNAAKFRIDLPKEVREHQKEREQLFLRQKEKGGIIDPDHATDRVVSLSVVRSMSNATETQTQPPSQGAASAFRGSSPPLPAGPALLSLGSSSSLQKSEQHASALPHLQAQPQAQPHSQSQDEQPSRGADRGSSRGRGRGRGRDSSNMRRDLESEAAAEASTKGSSEPESHEQVKKPASHQHKHQQPSRQKEREQQSSQQKQSTQGQEQSKRGHSDGAHKDGTVSTTAVEAAPAPQEVLATSIDSGQQPTGWRGKSRGRGRGRGGRDAP